MRAPGIRLMLTGPSRAAAGPGKPLARGPNRSITTSFRRRRDRDNEGVDREGTWGGVSPYHPTRGLGSVVSSLSGVRGGPGRNEFYAYLRSERSHLAGTPFSVFSSDGGPPKRRGARENFPLFSLSTGLDANHTTVFVSFLALPVLRRTKLFKHHMSMVRIERRSDE